MRNGYYEEALDLCTHVYQMEKKHGSIPIVKVCLDEEREWREMD